MRRRGRPGLIGTMARTAVIAGTAQAVTGNVAQKQQAKAQAAAQQQAPAPQYEAPPVAPPAAPADDMLRQLARLGQMNQAGLITDDEFSAAKAKLLGI
ncbi:MAG: hypothetical protein JWP10_287 [Nocardioidaceae bacterium]|nr:hypothetical protein [Nocardioidaceae bacterium]